MGYYIDLSAITIDAYKIKLQKSELIPSRRILKENSDARFNHFKSIGIETVKQLQQLLSKKDKLAELAKLDVFTEKYLEIMLREINSIQPKPSLIKAFTNISPDTVSKLEKLGIKNTVKLFDHIKTASERKELSVKAGISEAEILELAKLTDISRIKWVGTTFARMLYDVGIDTVEKAAAAEYTDLHKKINQLNNQRNYFKARIGLNDMKLFVMAAREVPIEVEF